MNGNIVFLDTETTGLDPERHEVWDIAIIDADGSEWNPLVRPVHLETADPTALRMNHYYETFGALGTKGARKTSARGDVASILAEALAGKHLVGAVPSFDAAFLDKFLRANGQVGAWHYHLIDVETMAVGYLVGLNIGFDPTPPLRSDEISLALGVDPNAYDRHTALGDARWVKAQYEAIVGDTVRP